MDLRWWVCPWLGVGVVPACLRCVLSMVLSRRVRAHTALHAALELSLSRARALSLAFFLLSLSSRFCFSFIYESQP